MKKLFVFSLAIAAIAAVSCQREQDFQKEEAPVASTSFEVNVVADRMDTRTTVVDGSVPSVKWLDTDKIQLFEIKDDAIVVEGGTESTTTTLTESDTKASFKVTLTGELTGSSFKYSAVYPASAVSLGGNSPKFTRLLVPATQHLNGTNLSADSDLLISTVYDKGSTRASSDENLVFSFRRVGSLVRLNLKGITPGEQIERVEITSPDAAKKLSGYVKYNPKDGTLYDVHYANATNAITLLVDNAVATGDDVVWFRVLATENWVADDQISIVVETDNAFYKRDGSDAQHAKITLPSEMQFIDGGLTRFAVGLGSYRIEKVPTDYSGDYLILARKGDSEPYEYFAMKGEANGTRIAQESYAGSIVSYEGDASLVWTVAASGGSYTIKNRGNYLGWADGNSADLIAEASYDADKCLMTITDNGNGTFKITNTKTPARYLAKNTGSDWFAFYGNEGQYGNIVLVPATALETVATPTFSPAAGEVDADTEVTISTATPGATIYYTVDGSTPTTSSIQGTSVIIDAAKTVKAFAVKDGMADSEVATAVFTITGTINYPTLESSNVTLTAGTNGSAAVVDGETAIKVGTSSAGGNMSVTVPAGTTKLHLHAAAWKGVTGLSLNISGATVSPTSIALNADDGISSNSPFTLTGNPEDFYFALDLSDVTSETEITFTSSANKRFVIWGVNAVSAPDNRLEASMVWKKGGVEASTDTASLEDGDNVMPTITLDNSAHSHPVTYSSSNTGVATIVESGAGAGTITLVSAGETVISAIFAGDEDYKPLTVSYTLTVSDNRTPVYSYDFENIAELNALVTSTSSTYKGYLTDAVVSFVAAANTAIVKDATGSVMFYKSAHGLLQGQTFTGAIQVTAVKYNSLYSEVTVWDASFAGAQTAVAPQSVTLDQLTGNYDSYQNAYVQVSGLTVSSISGKNINVSDGVNSYVVYDNTGSATCSVGDVITAVGTITKYQTTEELKVWKAADITVTASAPKAVTFFQPTGAAATAGCSIEVSVGGSPIASGTAVASGTTVTLTATPGTDYSFVSWNVTGASVANATEASTTFVMGASAVTISASFTDNNASGTEHEATITFGSGNVKINAASVTGNDSQGNEWTVTTVGTTSFTSNSNYYQVGSSSKPATSITFTTTLADDATSISLEAKFGGFSGTAGTVTLKVGDDSIGSGSLNAAADVVVSSTSTGEGKVLTVTVTNIAKGVKCYYIKATYTN